MTGAQILKQIQDAQAVIREMAGQHDFVSLNTMRRFRELKAITARQMRGIEMLADWGVRTDDGDIMIAVQ